MVVNDITPETQSVIDGIKIAVLKDELERLKEGGCRFNCRTEKDAYVAGWEDRDRQILCVADAKDSYKEWKKNE